MISLQAMSQKKLTKRLFWILPFLILVVFLVLFLRKDYVLNRQIREIALKFVQLEVLSRTRGVDFKAIFLEDHYLIQVKDRSSGKWKDFSSAKFSGGILCRPHGIEFIFSRGAFREFKFVEKKQKTPRYVILDLYLPEPSKKKGIIFYREGDWRVLS